MNRDDQIDKAFKKLFNPDFDVQNENDVRELCIFHDGATWADENPVEEEQHRRFLMDRDQYKKLEQQLAIAEEALNVISANLRK